MANHFLALSLFIMLLSFFLVLNGLSSFDEIKSAPVMNSLSVAFSEEQLIEEARPETREDLAESFREGDTLTQLESLFRSQISGVDIQKNRLGTTMHIRMPLEKFEKGIMMPGQSEFEGENVVGNVGGFFLPTLVSILQSADTIPHRMDMVLNIDGSPARLQNEKPRLVARNVDKAAELADRLEESGLPKKFITAGIGEGPEETVDLFFYRYVPFNPLGERASE